MKDFFQKFDTSKMRALHCHGDPVEILNATLSGVDLFETCFPFELSDKCHALIIQTVESEKLQALAETPTPLEASKMLKGKFTKYLDLSQQIHQEVHEPLQKECGCSTCKLYTKAYLYHLIEVKEMNANILIGMYYFTDLIIL